ncbi:MAG TPA: hypothetical protein VFR49_09065, partial [Solirubrobacteraceae bacterium]|nr:hypothetical protein [Solirubrobacteraceae bacterium]
VLWRARSRWLIALAALVALGAGGSVAVLRATAGDGTASAAAIDGLAAGTSRAATLERLGDPLTTTQARPAGAGPVLDCLVYRVSGELPAAPLPYDPRAAIQPVAPGAGPTAICFLHGRLVHRGGP